MNIEELFIETVSGYSLERTIDYENGIEIILTKLDYCLTLVFEKILSAQIGCIYFLKDFGEFKIKYGLNNTIIEFSNHLCVEVSVVDDRLFFTQTGEHNKKLLEENIFHDVKFERSVCGIQISRYSAFFDLIEEVPIHIYELLQGPLLELFKTNKNIVIDPIMAF